MGLLLGALPVKILPPQSAQVAESLADSLSNKGMGTPLSRFPRIHPESARASYEARPAPVPAALLAPPRQGSVLRP